MIHTYQISGMTCTGCEARIKSALLLLEDVTAAVVSLKNNTATITMDKHIPLSKLQEAIGGQNGKYRISPLHHNETREQAKHWLLTYKPVLLIFAMLTIVSVLIGASGGQFDRMQAMAAFMAGFFLTFSFFKLLDLSAFADSYSMYDLVAMKFKGWGYVYAFLELFLGLAYIIRPESLLVNLMSFLLMSISIAGVLRSVLNKQKIQCACLGTVFNLPMSTVTIMEDVLMIAMSGAMLLNLY